MNQCKDIPDRPVLLFLQELGRWGTWYSGFDNSVGLAMPEGTPEKLVRAKMASLIRRKLVDGCSCGCRGDYELTAKGAEILKEPVPDTPHYCHFAFHKSTLSREPEFFLGGVAVPVDKLPDISDMYQGYRTRDMITSADFAKIEIRT